MNHKILSNKIHNCPNCTGNSFREPKEEDVLEYGIKDIICNKCGVSYMLALKHPIRKINSQIKEVIGENSIEEVANKYNVDTNVVSAFLTNPFFYDLEMFKFAAKVLKLDIIELTSFICVSFDKYEEIVRQERDYWRDFN